MAGAGTTFAVQCNKTAFALRSAAVRLVPPGNRLPVADTVVAASAGDIQAAVLVSAGVRIAVAAVAHIVGVAVAAAPVRPAVVLPVSVPPRVGVPVAWAVARSAP